MHRGKAPERGVSPEKQKTNRKLTEKEKKNPVSETLQ